MEKKKLYYVCYWKEYISSQHCINTQVLMPLVSQKKIELLKDSEIMMFCRDHGPENALNAYIFPVTENGDWAGGRIFLPYTKDKTFHERNRRLYLKFRKNENILPSVKPDKDQKGLDPKQKFPSKVQTEPLKKLMEVYLKANPEPYTCLAIVNASEPYSIKTLETFLSIAENIFEPEEIMLPEKNGDFDSHKRQRMLIMDWNPKILM